MVLGEFGVSCHVIKKEQLIKSFRAYREGERDVPELLPLPEPKGLYMRPGR